ncbi:GrpB family protein [Microbacterium sp. A93]|uniref:GrpB family protein n=1 Tax=Microbacterium sp. A93 TaxID=3450716 RepID=UPI003F43CC1F
MSEPTVVLVSSQTVEWLQRYESMKRRLQELLAAARIEHIGSTAVDDIAAKADVVREILSRWG